MFDGMNNTAMAKINLSALSHNLAETRKLLPRQKIIAMIKSNAYGHGLIAAAKTLLSAEAFGVATISEALQLRAAGIRNDIVVMRGFGVSDEIAVFLNDPHLIACVHSPDQINLLKNTNPNVHQTLRIWLKIDTGMHRLGILPNEFQACFSALNGIPFIQKPFVVSTHLSDADNVDKTFTQNQFVQFEKLTRDIAYEKSVLNSAGILAHRDFANDWIRPGLMLYGVSPFGHHDSRDEVILKNFIPAMTFESKLIAVKKVSAGEKIGYSCMFTASHDMTIGIIGMGYGDSYPRQAKNGTPVLIRGERCPIVGRISMDMITVDVSNVKNVSTDDSVILWGKDLLVSEIAQYANTIPHELLCHLTGRVQLIIE